MILTNNIILTATIKVYLDRVSVQKKSTGVDINEATNEIIYDHTIITKPIKLKRRAHVRRP